MLRPAILIGALILVAGCGSDTGGEVRDLVFDLVTANAVIEVPPSEIVELGPDEASERTGAARQVTADFFLYEIESDTDPTSIDGVPVIDERGFRFYREPSFQSGLTAMMEGAASVVVILEQRPLVSDQGVSVLGRVVVLDADGSVQASDWQGGPGEDQLDRLADAVATGGLTWTEAIAALSSAARDDALDQPIEDALGAELLEVVQAG